MNITAKELRSNAITLANHYAELSNQIDAQLLARPLYPAARRVNDDMIQTRLSSKNSKARREALTAARDLAERRCRICSRIAAGLQPITSTFSAAVPWQAIRLEDGPDFEVKVPVALIQALKVA